MKKTNKIIISVILVVILALLAFLIFPKALSAWHWRQAASAAGGFPYQIGLTKALINKCVLSITEPPVCIGTTPPASELCSTIIDLERCPLYSDVSGTPAGGMGNNALFSNAAIAKAGLTPGGQLIAGGMSPVLMDQGVLASAGGCFGCVAQNGIADKIFAFVDKYIIAGIRDKIK
ncbi:MAG: hypothetical protein V1801_02655 [Candidatus Falkowbacteria bacterium]